MFTQPQQQSDNDNASYYLTLLHATDGGDDMQNYTFVERTFLNRCVKYVSYCYMQFDRRVSLWDIQATCVYDYAVRLAQPSAIPNSADAQLTQTLQNGRCYNWCYNIGNIH